MEKMILKKKQRKTGYIVFVIFLIILSFFLAYRLILKFGEKTEHILSSYAETSTRKLITTIINHSITQQVLSDDEINQLLIIQKNDNYEIKYMDFNAVMVTKFLNKMTNLIASNLVKIENGEIDDFFELESLKKNYNYSNLKKGIVYDIPLGAWTNNAFLSNIGPRVPVRLGMLGDVTSNLTTNIKEYGINNAMLEIGISVEVTALVSLPFFSKKIIVEDNFPIALKVIQGSIPNFYLDGLSKQSFLYSN